MKIVVDNSTSTLVDAPIDLFRMVKKLLSYKIPEAQHHFAGGFGSPYRYLIDKHGVFNTGLLNLLITYLDSIEADYEVQDLRKRPVRRSKLFSFNPQGVTPHQWQKDALDASVGHERGTISAATGSGKSLLMVMLVAKLQLKTLIIVPTLYLKEQLKATFLHYFGSLDNVTIENVASRSLNKLGKYDVLIVDEAHHAASATYQKLNKTNWNSIYHRYLFTATPFRAQVEEQLLFESIAGRIIYEIDYQEAVKQGLIVPIKAYSIEAPLNKVTGSKWKEVYNKLVVNNDSRNALITQYLFKFNKAKIPTLCLVKEISHGKELSHGWAFPFAYGEDKESKDFIDLFNKSIVKTLIGTTGVLGEGVDTKPAEIVVIAGMGKSRPQFIQMVGRVVRKLANKTYGTVILIDDGKNHRWGKTHYATQVEILRDVYGIEVERIEVK